MKWWMMKKGNLGVVNVTIGGWLAVILVGVGHKLPTQQGRSKGR